MLKHKCCIVGSWTQFLCRLLYSLCGSVLTAKRSPKCNLGSFCDCTQVKCLFKSIITIKVPLLRLTEFSFCESNSEYRSSYGGTTVNHAISHVTFLAFDFSIVSYMRFLFQLQGQYCGTISGTFVWIMLLNERLTHIHWQKDPWLHFGETWRPVGSMTNKWL